MPDYLDSSGFMKLVRSEPASEELRAALAEGEALVSSAVLVVEGLRAASRYGAVALSRARAALTAVTLVPLDEATLERAAQLPSPELRSLDALHLAAALELGADLRRF